MDVDISTVAGKTARSRTDAHADGSTFVSRKATIGGFTANPTRTLLADTLNPTEIIGLRFITSLV
jgi:hypothetical protein